MTAILTEEPPALDAKVPPPLRWTIARCHEKDPGARYESTRDLYHDLRNQQEHITEVFTSTEPSAPVGMMLKVRRRWLAAVPVAAALVVGLWAGWWSKPSGGGVGQLRFTPKEVALDQVAQPKWSPDGRAFAFSAEVAGVSQIFLRDGTASAKVAGALRCSVASPAISRCGSRSIEALREEPAGEMPHAARRKGQGRCRPGRRRRGGGGSSAANFWTLSNSSCASCSRPRELHRRPRR